MEEDKITFEYVENKVKNYITNPDDLALIKRAYEYANNVHKDEKRLNGEPYICHLLWVADILVDVQSDAQTICAGLLHDTLEYNPAMEDDLRQEFGDEITNLVAGVTKINNLHFNGDKKAVIESHRKILVGLCGDVRVIIIKFADRLHNMRTLYAIPPESQKEKAKETLDVLVPIASRLGMDTFKSELENLSLRYLKPDIYFSIVEKLNDSKAERDELVGKMINEVNRLLDENHIEHKTIGRSKSIYSIYKKLDKGRPFSDIYDILALRVFVNTKQECYQVLGIIHGEFKPVPKRFKDYIAMPKTNLYQSLHTTVIGIDGNLFEIQIRTYEMDQIDENGIASHWNYKEHGSTKANMQNAMEQKLQFFKSLMEIKNDNSSDDEFIKQIQDTVLKENIYVFTPNGDVIELPVGSTPIDFAYRIHSNVGDKMVGAIVNNNIVPLDYQLQTNDIVKINTNKSSAGPSKEWLNMAYTAQAKNKIKAFYNKIDKDEYQKNGEELIDKEIKKRKLANNTIYSDDAIKLILDTLKLDDLNELYVNVGNGKIPVSTVINIALNDNETKEDLIIKKVVNNKDTEETKPLGDVIVEGIDQVKVNIASCCKPIPGDVILGYITKGNGISIHRNICPNIAESEERLVSVHWNDIISKKYTCVLLIQAVEDKNVLLDIIAKTSNTDITVIGIQKIQDANNNLYELTIEVPNTDKLQLFVSDLMTIKNIQSVERMIR
jgi:guanosine-3',5'-bis(diphosphate) 3'-pyrophosphohydrolase